MVFLFSVQLTVGESDADQLWSLDVSLLRGGPDEVRKLSVNNSQQDVLVVFLMY